MSALGAGKHSRKQAGSPPFKCIFKCCIQLATTTLAAWAWGGAYMVEGEITAGYVYLHLKLA
jgi:hypothetical protein